MANKRDYKKAIPGTRGILANIARNLRVTRSAVSHYFGKHPDIKELANQQKQNDVDNAEDTIYTLAEMDTYDPRKLPTKLKAAQAIVNSQGKDRGWVEKKQLEHSGEIGGDTKLILEIIDAKDDSESSDEGSKKK